MSEWKVRPENPGRESLEPQSGDSVGAPLDSVTIMGAAVKAGDRVRLWPRKNADIFDMALKGKVAIIEAIERDFEDQVHLAVVVEDDPGRDLGMLRQPGHRFFYSPEEVEPLSPRDEEAA